MQGIFTLRQSDESKVQKEVNPLCTDQCTHLLGSDHSENIMNQVSDKGSYSPEDIKKIEEQKNSCGSIEHSNTSHGIHKNDGVAGIYGVVEEDDTINAYQKKKRLKTTELSDVPKTGLEIIEEAPLPGLPPGIGSTSLDQEVKFESVTPRCSESMSEKGVIAEEGISLEATENKLLVENFDCSFGVRKTNSNNEKVLIVKSNGNTSESHEADILPMLSTQIGNDELPRVAYDDACSSNYPLHLDIKELSSTSSDAKMINTSSCDADMPAINLLEQHPNEVKETISSVELHVKFEEENCGHFPKVSSGDALSGDTPLHHEEQSVMSDADLSLKQLDCLKGVASQVVNESGNVEMNRAFADYTGKKLLVLDVNGLLVDISSYVPYDYDPDDIILKKAVFKRPYCDDFLKFCFERFNVGVWSSRTKRNMEPILDFLLGNDKCKLLFCWDQSHCTYTGFYTVEKRYKPLLLKKLKKLWDKFEPDLPWERGLYNESNTLLLDDTPYKALSNPLYTAIFPYTYRFRDTGDNSLGPGGDLRIYLEGLALAENVKEYVKQNPFGQRPITEKNLSWGYYLKVIEASSTPPRQTKEDRPPRQIEEDDTSPQQTEEDDTPPQQTEEDTPPRQTEEADSSL